MAEEVENLLKNMKQLIISQFFLSILFLNSFDRLVFMHVLPFQYPLTVCLVLKISNSSSLLCPSMSVCPLFECGMLLRI